MSTTRLPLAAIRTDGGTQARVAIDRQTVDEYAEALSAGATLPPVSVFFDGAAYWLADGFHRLMANQMMGAANVEAEVHRGTQSDAKLHAYGANKAHGLRRSNEDKRRAVQGMLALVPSWSDNRIAGHVGVDHKTVAAQRQAILGNSQDAPSQRTVERNGKTYQLDTAGLRKAAAARNHGAACAEHCTPGRDPALKSSLSTVGSVPSPVVGHPAEATVGAAVVVEPQGEPSMTTMDLRIELQKALAKVEELEATMAANVNTTAQLDLVRRLDHATRRQHELMAEAATLQRRADFHEKQLKRCGRAVGQHDLGRVAAAVEALARQVGGAVAPAEPSHCTPAPAPALPADAPPATVDRPAVEPTSQRASEARLALPANTADLPALLTAEAVEEAGQDQQELDAAPMGLDDDAEVLVDRPADTTSLAPAWPSAPGRTVPAPEPDEAGCRPCANRLPRGNCSRPDEAGLSDGGFGIFWAPPGHAVACPALTRMPLAPAVAR